MRAKSMVIFTFFLCCLLFYSCMNNAEVVTEQTTNINPTHLSSMPEYSSVGFTPTLSRDSATEQVNLSSTPLITGSMPISIQLGMAVAQSFVYWVDKSDVSAVKRVRLTDTTHQIEIIARSTYTGGSVTDPAVSLNERWLVYPDSPTLYAGGEWKLIALDLNTHTPKVLLEASGAPYETKPIPSLELVWYSLSNDDILLAYAMLPGVDGCQRFVTRLVNLNDLHSRVLQETNCTASAEVWLWPQIDQHSLVAERDQPVSTGGGTNILLYALNTGAMTMLTQDGVNAQPYLSNDYVVWKRAYRSDFGLSAGVYNRHTQQTKTVTFPAKFSRMMVSEHWLYWIPDTLQSLYVYDLDRDHFIPVADSQNCMFSFGNVTMRGSMLVWFRAARDTNNFFLEWRSVAGLPSGPFTLCDPPKG